ncbi:hypothetical protein GC087_25145 (plasmid) [Pantoea sp. JZ2]|nr:hypothetical protein GC087_25145 [Pantoea sp. JZ2]
MAAKLPLQAKRPGYSEGTALCIGRFPAGGRKPAKKRSEATSLFLTEEMPPVGAASGGNVRAGNLPTGSRCGHR